jgi:hypothetical protein
MLSTKNERFLCTERTVFAGKGKILQKNTYTADKKAFTVIKKDENIARKKESHNFATVHKKRSFFVYNSSLFPCC